MERANASTRFRFVAGLPVCALLCAATAGAQSRAYVASATANAVSVVDAQSGTQLGTIPTGAQPADVAVAHDGSRAYVSNMLSDSISVIDTSAQSVIATIAVGDAPNSLALTPDGHELWVMLGAGDVQVVDTATSTVVATIPVSTQGGTVAITPDGTHAWVAAGSVYVIDVAARAIVDTLTAGTSAISLAIAPDGATVLATAIVYIFQPQFAAAGSVVTFDASTHATIATTNTYWIPGSIAVAPDGAQAYVALDWQWVNTGYGAGFLPAAGLTFLDTTTHATDGFVSLLGSPTDVAVSPDSARVDVTIRAANLVEVIDAATQTMISAVPVASGPGGLAEFLLPETGSVFCAGDGAGTECPCGNASAGGAGCLNSLGVGGELRASGAASLAADTLVLHGTQMPSSSALYFQGTSEVNGGAGAVFGDGLRCAGGSTVRLAAKSNASGASSYPVAGELSVSAQGNVTSPGVRTYQIWYRNAGSFCTPDTFNLTNGVAATWTP